MSTSTTMTSTYGAPAAPYESDSTPSNPASFRSQSKLREILRDQSRREEQQHQQHHHHHHQQHVQHYFGGTNSLASTSAVNDLSVGGLPAAVRHAQHERQRRPSLVTSVSAALLGSENLPRRRRETLLTSSKTCSPFDSSAMAVQQASPPIASSSASHLIPPHSSPLPRQRSLRRTHDHAADAEPGTMAVAAGASLIPAGSTSAAAAGLAMDADSSRLVRSHSAATNLNGGIDLKVVILGSQGVGKTSLVHRYTSGQFSASAVPSTIGASFLTKKLIVDGVKVRLQLWDTAGQERFRSMAPMYYRGANAAVIVYDITNPHSFEDVKTWIDELRQNVQSDLIIHIVGSKVDLAPQERRVRFDDAQQIIANWTAQQGHDLVPADTIAPTAAVATSSIFGSRKGVASSPSFFSSAVGQSSSPPSSPTANITSGGASGSRIPALGSLSALGAKNTRSSYDRTEAIEGDRASNPSTASSSATHHKHASPHDWNFIDVSEVSAKDNEGIEDVFVGIATRLVERKEELEARALAKRRQDRQSVYIGDGVAPDHYLTANPQAHTAWCCST